MLPDLIVGNRQTLGLFEVRNYLPLFWRKVNGVQSSKHHDSEKHWVQTPHDLLKQWISRSWWLSKITYIVKGLWSVQPTLLCSTICFYIDVTPLIDVKVFVGGRIVRCSRGSVSSNDCSVADLLTKCSSSELYRVFRCRLQKFNGGTIQRFKLWKKSQSKIFGTMNIQRIPIPNLYSVDVEHFTSYPFGMSLWIDLFYWYVNKHFTYYPNILQVISFFLD